MTIASVPFEHEQVGVVGAGILATRVHGVLRLESSELVLEFRSTSSDLREYTGVSVIIDTSGSGSARLPAGTETELRTVRIPLEHVVALELTGGFLRAPRLQLEVNRVDLLADVPWASGVRCTIGLRRSDRQRARALAVDTQLRLAEARLDELEGST